jgi:hypothetical protein
MMSDVGLLIAIVSGLLLLNAFLVSPGWFGGDQ